MKAKHAVTVLGQTFQVRTPAGAEHMEAVAAEVNRRIETIRRSTRGAGGQSLAVMVALDLADEFLRSRTSERALRERVSKEVRALLAKLDSAPASRQDRSRG